MTKEHQRYSRRLSSSSRALALEQAYVHDVYSMIAIHTALCSPVRSHIKEFLFEEFDSGSILLDIGCSDGKYLNLKSDIVLIGLERCSEWFGNDIVKNNNKELVTGDVMYLPFRDEFFDGIICCGVLHHISTVDRRVKALKEMTRIMKIGGKLLISVTSGPAVGRELQSQDVLIKLDNFQHKLNHQNGNSSETDSESSSSGYSNSNYGNTLYESCNSPNSEFGSCYSFVRKALRKFSFTGSFGSLQSRRTSNKSKTSNSSSVSKEDFPIELRNIEDEESVNFADESVVNCNLSSMPDNNKSRSNLLNSSSLLSIIKEHIISFQFQFKQKNSLNTESNDKKNGFLSQHRFSLPINFKSRNDNCKLNPNLNVIHRSNKYVIEESQELSSNTSGGEDVGHKDSRPLKNIKDRTIKKLQKSFSSDSLSSRQASWDATGGRLIAYYSMPELHTLSESNEQNSRMSKYKPKLIDLHPITFIRNKNTTFDSDQSKSKTESKTESSENELTFDSHRESQTERVVEQIASEEQTDEKESLLEKEEMDDYVIKPEESVSQTQSNNKFAKKLLRQRSFSADYQPEVPKPVSDVQPRRFSASPNIGASRVNPCNQYYNQMSIDSEESFITIIPANRSTRESVTEAINNSDTFADLDAEYLSSSTDDACCEDIEGSRQTSEDNTSASSVTEVTTKSTDKQSTDRQSESECQSSTTPSPPTTLHRYFHVFRSGELEQLIEQNIQNLHVINSYYNERATSWCVVVEKVHVWTI